MSLIAMFITGIIIVTVIYYVLMFLIFIVVMLEDFTKKIGGRNV